MTAEIINLLDRRRPTEPSGDYLGALAHLRVLRETAAKLGWVLPKDPTEATIQFAVQIFRLVPAMMKTFTPGVARASGARAPSRRSRAKPKPIS